MFRKFCFLLAVCLAMASCHTLSDTNTTVNTVSSQHWTQSGLVGRVNVMTVIGTTIFAGTPAGVYRSDDNGDHWSDISNGLGSLDVTALAAMGSTLYVGTVSDAVQGGAVSYSTDKGSSWTAISANTIDLFQYSTSLGFVGSKLFSASYGDVWRWSGNGMNWTKLNVTGGNLATIGTELFTGSSGGPMLSTDVGNTWTPANNGLPNSGLNSIFANGNDLYIGTQSNPGTVASVYLSSDNGSHWSQANSGLPVTYKGATYDNQVYGFDAIGDTIYAGSENGIYNSTNRGTAWLADTAGLHDLVFAFAHNDSYIFAGTYASGVWRSHR